MILERRCKLYYNPKKKKTSESYRMVIHGFGNIDPIDKISELSGHTINETRRFLGVINKVYEELLLKGYTVQIGEIAKMSLYTESKSFTEEDRWMAMKESVKAVRLKTLTTSDFKRKLKESLGSAEYWNYK